MVSVIKLIKEVLISKNNHYNDTLNKSVSIFKVILFVWNKWNSMFIMSFYPPVCSYKCKLFLHRIVVTKIELSYFVCFVKPCLPRKKKGVDDIFSLFFFLSTLVRSVCILSIYDWHVCPWGFKTRYSKQILYLSVVIVCF